MLSVPVPVRSVCVPWSRIVDGSVDCIPRIVTGDHHETQKLRESRLVLWVTCDTETRRPSPTLRAAMEYRNHIPSSAASSDGSRVAFRRAAYVYDADVLRRQIAQSAQRSRPAVQPFYAMKANSNVSLLRHPRAGFEVMRCRRARSIWPCAWLRPSVWFTCSNVSDDDLRAIPDRASSST